LSGIQQDESVVGVGDLGERFDVLDASGDIGGVTEDHQTCGGLPEAFEELVGIQQSGFRIEREVGDGDATGLLEVFEWSEDGVVFEFGGDDVVTGLQESEDDGVEAGCAARGEEEVFGAWCVEQFGECGASLQEQGGGAEGGGVTAASGRAAAAEPGLNCVEDRVGTWRRCGGVIEVHGVVWLSGLTG
jgi:hypothetical protein